MNGIDPAVAAAIQARGITELTHFTPSRNVPRIIEAGQIQSTAALKRVGAVFESTDPERIDNHEDHISCNFVLPNTYYFSIARNKSNARNYPDWVLFLIDPEQAAREGTLFCPVNGAKAGGRFAEPGVTGLERMFEHQVDRWSRGARHRRSSPTDVQAEVHVPGPIPLNAITAAIVPTEEALHTELAILDQLGIANPFSWWISEDTFNRNRVAAAVRESTPVRSSGPWTSSSPTEGTR